MISVSVEADISKAVEFLRLLPREAERAAYRSMNKIADEVAEVAAREIATQTGIPKGTRKAARSGGGRGTVHGKLYVNPAKAGYLLAEVKALGSATNVGFYKGAFPRQRKPGVEVTAYGKRKVYDRAFVKGPSKISGRIRRKVWRRTGPGDADITDVTYGPSIRVEFRRPMVQARCYAEISRRWPHWFQHYLRGELVKLRGAEVLRGVKDVLPGLVGPTFVDG